jgi:hypothetical protein
MAKSKPSKPPKPKGKSKFGTSTWITLAIVLPVLWLTFRGFQRWSRATGRTASFDSEVAARNASNARLKVVYDATQLKRFEACNKAASQITINWLTVAYHDGKSVKIFDSDKCREWQPLVLAPGDSKAVVLRSSQAGCNWGGEVFYYAMKYTEESEEKYNSYHVVGPYQGFDRDCYTFVG